MKSPFVLSILLLLLISPALQADGPFPPHKVVSNIYYVGSRDISSYLVTTPEGHVIINSGFEETVPLIRGSVESLGFKLSDVKVLLSSHAHSDHVAGHGLLQELTGAKVFVMKGDDGVIKSGGKGQYLYTDSRWRPCPVDRVLKDGDKVELGGTTLVARRTPGHTRGCTTWTCRVTENGKKYDVVIVGSPNVNPGYELVNNSFYPDIADDYAKGFAILKKLPCDFFLGAHGKYYGMHEKYDNLKGAKQSPFIDPKGYLAYITEREATFRKKLAEEKKQKGSSLFSGIDPDGFDKNVRPQDDLFLHVNGRWILRTEIPPDKSNYGSFITLVDEAQARIRSIIEDAAENPADENGKKVGDFFTSYMNEELVEKRGLKPLAAEIAEIEAIDDLEGVIRHFGYFETNGAGSPLGFFVDQDDRDSTRYLAAMVQSGTTLPDRDYYLGDDEKYVKARKALAAYIEKLFRLSDRDDAGQAAKAILQLETDIARVQWERTELRNAEKRYNKYQVKDLGGLSKDIPWSAFFKAVETPDLEELNVMTPSYFEGVGGIIAHTPLKTLKQYLHFRLIDAYAPVLPKAFVDAHFELHDKELAGVPEQKPRWKRAVDTASGYRGRRFGVLGDAVGQLYVKKYFKPEARRRMNELVGNLLKTFETSIHELEWMTDATKKQALIKLSKITPKIGYTEKWRDYSTLEIKDNDLVGNMQRSYRHAYHRMINKLGKPVDRTEWGMTPQTVNAYYNPGMNEIVFPAAILQPPFFDPEADDAVNYGGIGAVIGHEISHGFDDQGSKYDGDGNLKNWWTDEDRKAFETLTGQLVAQYEGYEALPGKKLNGRLTLGENIADLSGMAIAYKAYRLSLGGKDGPVIDGFTSSQRFFLGWGQIWRRKYRDSELIRRLVVDPHSPSHFRSNGPVTNLDAFHEAFNVKPGDKMYKPKEKRIRIW